MEWVSARRFLVQSNPTNEPVPHTFMLASGCGSLRFESSYLADKCEIHVTVVECALLAQPRYTLLAKQAWYVSTLIDDAEAFIGEDMTSLWNKASMASYRNLSALP